MNLSQDTAVSRQTWAGYAEASLIGSLEMETNPRLGTDAPGSSVGVFTPFTSENDWI